MEDTITPNISIALYRYLCQHIVGSEDHVKTIRLMNAVRDNVISNTIFTVITSGSFGEGLEMRGSDLDTMFVFKCFQVFENRYPHINQYKTYFSLDRDDVKPGFTQLRLEYISDQKKMESYEKYNGRYYLSNATFKQQFVSDLANKIHGPCISDKNGLTDNACCIHCKTWVSPAVQWITRIGNSWPSDNVKQSIIKHGVLFVPVGVKESPKEDLEWRISFSVGEKLLINTFTHTQLMCYALLKIILKDVINPSPKCKDLLCSYYLKTIIFWISEELPQSIWKPDNIIPCLMRCFRRLIYCVEHSVCLHYFIPENNMFENKIEGRVREILLEKLYELHRWDWQCILFSDQVSNFYKLMCNFHIEPHTLYVKDAEKIQKSKIMPMTCKLVLGSALVESHIFIYRNGMAQNVLCQQSSIKYIYAYFMSKWCNENAQVKQVDHTIRNNKYQYNQYNQYKYCLCTLLTNIYHDAISGWLMVASLFYKTKQYVKALRIIVYSLSKCTQEKLYRGMTMSDIHYQLLKQPSSHKKSLIYLQKEMFVDYIEFNMKSTLIPDEFKTVNSNSKHCYPSTAYAHFLKFLCHYHLNDVRQCQDSLISLELVIEENFLIADMVSKARANTLFRIALQLFGD